MSPPDPLPAIRAAVARAAMPTAATRLVTLDAADLVGPDAVAADVAFASPGQPAPPGTARADPLRLPLVEGVADIVVAREPLAAGVQSRLREVWRVLAPAGVVVLVVPLPTRWPLWRDLVREQRRGYIVGLFAASMFDLDGVEVVPGAIVARAVKIDGLAPARRQTTAVTRQAPA